ncbi:MAG: hypothetical protein IKB98_10395 [Clostridia bacterium]|nr:hypothetical protein [Clostridia bacterium]
MNQTENEQTLTIEAHTAEAENQDVGEVKEKVSFGKFKDVESLIHAYNSLQSEFTKRCQRIKELEGEAKAVDKAVAPTVEASEENATAQGLTEEEKAKVLKDYLKSVVESKQKAIVLDGSGSGVKTPVPKPKTIAEAGALAKEIINSSQSKD